MRVQALSELNEKDYNLESFSFDVFRFNEIEKQLIAYTLFQRRSYFDKLNIPNAEFANFLYELRAHYNWVTETKKLNAFHNFNHGINVMQGCYMVATHTRAREHLDYINEFSLIFAGLCHDVNVSI